MDIPAEPIIFSKATSALSGPFDPVKIPEGATKTDWEVELGVVIGKTCRRTTEARAYDFIAGYTIGNDYGLHDFRDTDAGSMLRVKGSDTLCPIGPSVVTGWDFRDKRIRTLVNGEVKQDGNTSEMEWDMHYLIADLARTVYDFFVFNAPATEKPQ